MLDNDVLSPHEIYFRLVQYDLDWHFLTSNTDKIKLYFYVSRITITTTQEQNQTVHLTLNDFNEQNV